ncbi:hypothetical protein SBV1_850022 [Verrucomicrobia bacterium]|nr:hypothetical protein SBV1_850022 [Verrucomicrobiota bacterium]
MSKSLAEDSRTIEAAARLKKILPMDPVELCRFIEVVRRVRSDPPSPSYGGAGLQPLRNLLARAPEKALNRRVVQRREYEL